MTTPFSNREALLVEGGFSEHAGLGEYVERIECALLEWNRETNVIGAELGSIEASFNVSLTTLRE